MIGIPIATESFVDPREIYRVVGSATGVGRDLPAGISLSIGTGNFERLFQHIIPQT